ncbi:MAG: hypothetical protein NTY93_01140 [Candidatus Kaiserbacteria bacterium]|nr:hypothetical protein [Candidatus Kaiserbacteria bacterium]
MVKILFWAPRVVGILAILFISLFALDVFQEGASIAQMFLGLAIHLVPIAMLAIFLVVAWKYEIVGGILFVAISFIPFFLLRNLLWVNAMLCAPFLLTGILFFVSSRTASASNHAASS